MQSGQTADNKRFSEMAVDVETGSLLLPMTLCCNSGCGAPNPPLRQAAGRYLTFPLLRYEFIGNALREAEISINAEYLWRCKSETNNS